MRWTALTKALHRSTTTGPCRCGWPTRTGHAILLRSGSLIACPGHIPPGARLIDIHPHRDGEAASA